MPERTSSIASRWLFALKPASWPKIFVPLTFGVVLGAHDANRFDPTAALVVAAFALCDTIFIVLLNDWADVDVDTLKRRLFPKAGSPKALVDGIVSSRAMLMAGTAAACTAVAVALFGHRYVDGPWFGVATFACLGIFVAYSLPPLKLNYRGGGELLEAIGVGGALPWLAAYSQTGRVWSPGMGLLVGLFLLSFSSATASGLSDEVSDRYGGKHTVATLLGNRRARGISEGALLLGGAAWVAVGYRESLAWWIVLPAALVVWWRFGLVRRESASAITNQFASLRNYKTSLHRAIWESTLLLSFLLLVDGAMTRFAHRAGGGLF